MTAAICMFSCFCEQTSVKNEVSTILYKASKKGKRMQIWKELVLFIKTRKNLNIWKCHLLLSRLGVEKNINATFCRSEIIPQLAFSKTRFFSQLPACCLSDEDFWVSTQQLPWTSKLALAMWTLANANADGTIDREQVDNLFGPKITPIS